jgi:hypothetical protein
MYLPDEMCQLETLAPDVIEAQTIVKDKAQHA